MFVARRESEINDFSLFLSRDCSGLNVESFSGRAPYFVIFWKLPHEASANVILADWVIAVTVLMKRSPRNIKAAYIITPPRINKTTQWLLSPLLEVWQVEASFSDYDNRFITHAFITDDDNAYSYTERTYREWYRKLIFRTTESMVHINGEH